MEHHVTATKCHLPCGITQCYLLPDTSERIPPSPQPVRPVLDLPTPEGISLACDTEQIARYLPKNTDTANHPPLQITITIDSV